MIATSNPIEYEGTYPLPEAQLDRFLMRVSFGYPQAHDEWDVLRRRIARQREEQQLSAVTDAAGLLAMQAAVESITVDESVSRYCVSLAVATRDHVHVLVGASPRGSLALLLTGRAVALIAGRDFVIPEDIKSVAVSALAHRITIKPELWMSAASGSTVVNDVLSSVPVPSSLEPSSTAKVSDDGTAAARRQR